MSRALALGLVLTLWTVPLPVAAQMLDPVSASALAATLNLLQDPARRDAMIAGHPQAAAADRQMQALLGTPALREEFYALAAAIFADVAQRAGGDPGRMAQTLATGQADPAPFVAGLRPETAERLRAFAAKLSAPKP
jgi:hypothetical protein